MNLSGSICSIGASGVFSVETLDPFWDAGMNLKDPFGGWDGSKGPEFLDPWMDGMNLRDPYPWTADGSLDGMNLRDPNPEAQKVK